MRLRPAAPEDAPALVANVQEGFEGYRVLAPPGWSPPHEVTEENVDRLRADLGHPATFVRVAEVDGAFAGHVTVVAGANPSRDGAIPDHHLKHLFVRAPFWGTGVALALHTAAIEWMTGTARLYTPAFQARARRFYEREGWTLHDGPYPEPRLELELVEYRRGPWGRPAGPGHD